ncbi:hypothetical protein F2P79_025384 [Pimephales promelas]|nr:hypothetical protein F2P79_025384 [Pimephales promelas]
MWVSGRVTYPKADNLTLRTNETYRAEIAKQQKDDAISVSPFLRLPLDMVNQFPIDYMHQACLGVTKKMITEWMRGNRNVRMSAGQINEVTQRLLTLRKDIPSCFARKPRGLEDIDRWKATELRQFAVYTGKIVLKGILADQLYDHFMTFSVALGLLLSPNLAVDHNDYSSQLMKYFVEKTKELYGDHFMVYNIHSMIHLSAEAINFGCLDACSAFPFENFLGKLKRLVRSGKKPLIQVAKRLMEMSNFPQTQSMVTTKFKTTRPNNAFILEEGKCCVAIEEREEMDESGSRMLLCKVFERSQPLFKDPYQPLPKTYPQDKGYQEKPRSPDLFSEALLPCSLQSVSPPHQADQMSDLLLREPQASSEEATKNYRTKVLQKLQELCENQQDILTLQRRLLAAMTVPGVETEEEILENGPCQTVEELKQFDTSLENKETRTKMVNYLRSIGGTNPGAAVRKMLRKVATNEVLSAYSLRGKKTKMAFQELRICSLIIGNNTEELQINEVNRSGRSNLTGPEICSTQEFKMMTVVKMDEAFKDLQLF